MPQGREIFILSSMLAADSYLNKEEQEFLEHQIKSLEGKPRSNRTPTKQKDLKRYV